MQDLEREPLDLKEVKQSEDVVKIMVIPPEDDVPEMEDEEKDEFSLSKFAAQYFQGSATHTHIEQRLRQPLLPHEDEGDALVMTTFSFMIISVEAFTA